MPENSTLQIAVCDDELIDCQQAADLTREIMAAEGIEIGDTVKDSSTELAFEVVGFSDGQMYGHTSVGFITTDSYTALRSELNPNYEPAYHAVVLQGGEVTSVHIDGAEVVVKSDIIDSLPGYTAEQATIRMIVWVLIVVSAAIIGVFYYILTLQKERQFGVIKQSAWVWGN